MIYWIISNEIGVVHQIPSIISALVGLNPIKLGLLCLLAVVHWILSNETWINVYKTQQRPPNPASEVFAYKLFTDSTSLRNFHAAANNRLTDRRYGTFECRPSHLPRS